GDTGPIGIPGEAGATGLTGAAGTTGSIGATGLTGTADATGLTGTTGPTGATGTTGPAGTGTSGPAGTAGATGAAGTVALLVPSFAVAQQPLVLGIHPYLSSTEIYTRFSPLADRLAKELGRPVQIRISSDYDTHVTAVGKGEVDIAFVGPAQYVFLTRTFGKIPLLAAFETKAGRTFKGVIVVRQDSAIQTLSQLRGKSFAFGPLMSTMSNLVPRAMLLKAGIDLKDLSKAEFLTNQENIALGVLSGNYDAGAIKDDIFNQYTSHGLRALAVSQPMPDHLFVARQGLPDETVNRISASLLALSATGEGREILTSIQKTLTALVPVRDADYDPLRTVLDDLARAEK
ncbi:MAG: phosphate/phosphite/phosphonate ABC transporter substrate-binding protein, partial [Candidatus Methylomirabilia bacterium]